MTVVLFGLDKILIDGQVIDALALKHRFYYELNRLRTNLNNGLITPELVTESIFKLMAGLRVTEINYTINNIPLMPNSKKMLNNLRNEGLALGIISDYPDIILEYFIERFKLDYSIGHKVEIKDGKLTGKVTLYNNNGQYYTWKREAVRKIRNETRSEIIAVGKRELDAPMLKEADYGVAFNAPPKVEKAADTIIKEKDINNVLEAINCYINDPS